MKMPQQHRRPKDRKHIDVNDPQELLAQSHYLGRSPQEVAFAVSKVGPEIDAVAAFLGV